MALSVQRWSGAFRYQSGFGDQAMEVLEGLAETPRYSTSHALRLDPIWDPVRDHPRFQALVAERERRERMK